MAWLFKPDGTVLKVEDDQSDSSSNPNYYLYEPLDNGGDGRWWKGSTFKNGKSYWTVTTWNVPAELKAKLLLLKD